MTPETADGLEPTQQPKTSKRKLLMIGVPIMLLIVGVGGYLTLQYLWADDGSNSPQQVTINNGGFEPATVKVKRGDEIVWRNNDNKRHGLIIEQLPGDDTASEPLNAGDSYVVDFEKSGTFAYYDPEYANNLKGVIIVE